MPADARPFRFDRRSRRSFTLTELLVVIAVIGIVGALTIVAYRGIAKDARLSSAENAVTASIERARGLAMKRNNYVVVAFRTAFDENNDQRVEVITAEWTGESPGPWVIFAATPLVRPVDRFIPIPGVPVRTLPKGIGVACPTYGYADGAGAYDDTKWFTLSNLRKASEAPGNMIAVLYSPEGTVVSRNGQADSYRQYIDLTPPCDPVFPGCGFGKQDMEGFACTPIDYNLLVVQGVSGCPQLNRIAYDETLFEHENPDDEPYLRIAPFVAVYDDDEAREQYDATQWNDFVVRRNNQSAFINANGKRIHFNRYSGVVMR